MKIKHIINEDVATGLYDSTLINYIRKNCQSFLSKFADKPPIYRTADKGDGFTLLSTPSERTPISSTFRNPLFRMQYNKLLKKNGHNDRVKNVVFGTTASPEDYVGIDASNWYYLIPVGDFSFTYDLNSGSDFNTQHKHKDALREISFFIDDNADNLYLDRMILNKDYFDKAIQKMGGSERLNSDPAFMSLYKSYKQLFDDARDLSSEVDNDIFADSIKEKTQQLSDLYFGMAKKYLQQLDELSEVLGMDEYVFLDDYGLFVKKMKERVADAVIVKDNIENHVYTDVVKDAMFSNLEIIIHTQKFLLVDIDLISYEELIQQSKEQT